MAFMDTFLPEFDREMGTTRRLLERTPLTNPDWAPHAKSRTLLQLATHIAYIPSMATLGMNESGFDSATPRPERPPITSTAALVQAFDEAVQTARAAMAAKTDAELMAPWTLRHGNRELFTVPKVGVLRNMCLNHIIHHRGQLSVYLRMQDVPLPSIYGPSADEAL